MKLKNLIWAWIIIAALLFVAAILEYPACVGVAAFLEFFVTFGIVLVYIMEKTREEPIDYSGEL